ncbi:MAG: addiction module protein [Propionibacteriaceae bacterium]|nr:addiction module protein [Propionibacteriaceae bacterium]
MVSTELRETVDALSVEERISLMEYLESTIDDFDDDPLTDKQLATLDRRNAEMDANPSMGISEEEFFRQVRARLA